MIDISKMRIAGALASDVLDMIAMHVRSGVTTGYLNDLCHEYITEVQGAIPAPLNYKGFPKSICTSVNHQVCHGIPGKKKLKDGDIINIDVTVIKDGHHGDTSRMFQVGKPTPQGSYVCQVAYDCLELGIDMVKPGLRLGDLGHAIDSYARRHNCTTVKDFCGHGIGRNFHEPPYVFHHGIPGTGEILKPGMTFTIEPMINLGKDQVKILPDGWTVVTKDRRLSAQWEHTILVTDTGCDVLTA